MLEVENLHAYYGKSHILQGVAFNVGEGEIVSLLGRNGVGRSTTCKSIMGLVPPRGSIRFKGEELAGLSAHRIARKGIGYVPEDRLTFSGLSTRENLEMGVQKVGAESRWTIDDAYRLFPRLSERADVKADLLSGGEQQMLSMCRTMMGNPALVMIDEPTEGLAPQIVEQVGDFLLEVAASGVSILLVEQKLSIAMRVSHRVYVMGHGQIVFEGTPQDLQADDAVRREWLEV
ncbi:ABC transporter ATP-binding protein [Salinisphaera sp.]|uniref:ABC transporter ATP-binding protein n=1 Tax=Salinisphaera sp. TaxID=1914330 RepID=UPI000C67D4FD|nr:ABC transporter ATP-binding protein [Salinisphaera sp.]MAS09287.1 ABC transporter ATP-binding protein [Salinisphaera sp.]|tara:strand:+ start:231 stop:926 length:696 start_codon:yes stop_codon:yes gene_type:complete